MTTLLFGVEHEMTASPHSQIARGKCTPKPDLQIFLSVLEAFIAGLCMIRSRPNAKRDGFFATLVIIVSLI
jgi:hypothetical protein